MDLQTYLRKYRLLLGRYEGIPYIPLKTCTLSVQVNEFTYCQPRNSQGPWTHVEVGVMDGPVPASLQRFLEEPESWVCPYVPIELVQELIDAERKD